MSPVDGAMQTWIRGQQQVWPTKVRAQHSASGAGWRPVTCMPASSLHGTAPAAVGAVVPATRKGLPSDRRSDTSAKMARTLHTCMHKHRRIEK